MVKNLPKSPQRHRREYVVASSLLEQIDAVPEVRLFPSQLRLLSKYRSFLSLNFPESREFVTSGTKTAHKELSEILGRIYFNNDSFAAYTDACLQTAEKFQMLRSLLNRRKESRIEENLEKGNAILSDVVYELICRYFASRDDWLALERSLTWLREDGIPPTFNVFMASLECLGGLLHRSINGMPFPKSLNHKLATEHRIIHSYVEEKALEIIALAENYGINVYEDLLRYPRQKQSLQRILTALFFVTPGREPVLSFYAARPTTLRTCKTLEITKRVSSVLDKTPLSPANIFADVFPSSEAMVEAFQEQLRLEVMGQVPISPVLPFFEEMLKEAPEIAKTAIHSSKQLRTRSRLAELRQSLEAEQNTHWRRQLTEAFEATLQRLKVAHARGQITAYPFLKILPKKSYVDLMIQAINTIVTDTALQHVGRSLFLLRLGERVEAACVVWRKQNAGILEEMAKSYKIYAEMFTSSTRNVEHFREMWLRALQVNAENGVGLDQEWPKWNSHILLTVGHELYRILYDNLTFNINALRSRDTSKLRRQEANVLFEVSSDNPGEARYEIRVHPTLLKWYSASDRSSPLMFNPAELPMLCPPLPWIDTKHAGYLLSSNDATRFIRKTNYFPGGDAAANDDLDFEISTVPLIFDSLNALAACPWKVNKPILDAMLLVARGGGDKNLSIPETKSLFPIPPKKFDSTLTREERIAAYRQAQNIRKIHDETRSLWATETYRLSIANHYRDKVFWFPHSMDFRGRVYPCPPHFHHMGSDVARGLIVFAKGLPLGERGLRWLKIHLANLTGNVKRSSNDEREAYIDSILDEIVDSADRPFDGRGWWREQEEPWQTLACCRELTAALRHSTSPSTYVNHFPVHQDGSCNGLQHYAAMGRDERGAASVSLEDCERPRDVYSDVTEVVEARRRADAAEGNEIAITLEGAVQRRVIKQSVMTTVYGVTLYGAMAQIRRQLRELPIFQTPAGADADRRLGPASAYLARLTLSSIGAIFSSSTATQAWFAKAIVVLAAAEELAKHITRFRGCRISWITPLGLPVVQPYVSQTDFEINLWSGELSKAAASTTSWATALTKAARHAERQFRRGGACDSLVGLPLPDPVKQQNAFPPNFIHSLDSCHMMLTALHCLRVGVMFASVHDCFWTHAASVDQLNRVIVSITGMKAV
ncbi:DNA-directed RNA polymerase mitochondrial [Taenia crassiceps]|uniref:DNA-directed RNA polymerase n=1 Tax=Taenia crassiceps TaxID=6207 RepID=A0ABR4QHH0_9CEST